MSKPVVVVVRDVTKSYENGHIPVLDKVGFTVREGETVALWGASGSGKSTLLHLVGGLDSPDSGEVRVCGLDTTCEKERLTMRRLHTGYVFQLHNLIPDLTLWENVTVPLAAVPGDKTRAYERLRRLCDEVGLSHRLGQRVQKLSGGERQRTAIVRALANKPKVLLADEPTGSLDESTGERVFDMMKALANREGVAVLLATHERRFAAACGRILRVRDGKIVEVSL